jgi:hypothetical protein
MEYMTPSTPPKAHSVADIQYGKPLHQPIITRPGSTKMMDDSVPADDAMVCTMLVSPMELPAARRSKAMEMTAAGMDVAKVSPALRPK